jgi:probable addiction module antidote protein
MPKGYVNYEESLTEALRDPQEAANYLNACLDGGSREVLLLALRQIATAHGISRLSRESKLGRESLYRTLSAQGNPRLDTLVRLLDAVGLELAVKTKKRKRRAA